MLFEAVRRKYPRAENKTVFLLDQGVGSNQILIFFRSGFFAAGSGRDYRNSCKSMSRALRRRSRGSGDFDMSLRVGST
jgi:hypothetical protein